MTTWALANVVAATGGLAVALAIQSPGGVSARAQDAQTALRTDAPAAAEASTITTYCVSCHSERRKAGGLSLASFDAANPTADIDAAERVIRKLRSGMMPPRGAPQPAPGVLPALADAIETAVDRTASARVVPGFRPSPRLTRAEYAADVHDLVGVDVDTAALLPADTVSAGFDNIADVQTPSPALITGYLRAARVVSLRATADPGNRTLFVCQPRRPSDEDACARRILGGLVARAYRGTAAAEDLADAQAFYTQGRTAASFRDGIQLAVQAILVSPKFVFRLEPAPSGGSTRVPDLALASRLSYFLWGRGPDPALLEAARRGFDTATIDMQVRRLLRDARSEALATRFARQWLRLQDLDGLSPSVEAAPGFDRALLTSMRRETELFVDSIVREDRSVLDLLTADYSFVDQRLAKHYGYAPVSGAGFVRVPVPPARRGLLGQASILASTSLADRTSPVLRGKWVLEVLLGTPPPPPPPNVPSLDDTAAPIQAGVRVTTRQRIERHRRSPQCAACHTFIDPLGLTLENFDVTGTWRAEEHGTTVDVAGELFDGTRVDGPEGLRQLLLDRRRLVLQTFTEQLLTYALGRRLAASDMPVVRGIVASAARDGYRVSAFVRAVAVSAPFTQTSAGS